MSSVKRLAAVGAAFLISVAVAAAAVSPSGVYQGTLHNKYPQYPGGKSHVYTIQTTFKQGRLTRLRESVNDPCPSCDGVPGVPFDPKLSSKASDCPNYNGYDSSGKSYTPRAKITGKTANGSFAFTLTDQVHNTSGQQADRVTVKGRFVSAKEVSASIRFFSTDAGPGGKNKAHCDSGQHPVTLKLS
jgi:hypothetical protein